MANSFERGQAQGLQAWQTGAQVAQGAMGLAERSRANTVAEGENQIRTRLMEERSGQLRQQFMVEAEARKRDAANQIVSKTAYDNWLREISVLDKSANDYIERYQDITAQYIGDIQMSQQYAGAAQARLKADQANMQNSNAATFQLAQQRIISDMAKYDLMPDAMAIAADVKVGRYSAETGMFFAQAKIKAAKEEERRQALRQQAEMFWTTKAAELAVKEYEDTRQALRKSLDMEAKAKGAELELQRAESNRLRQSLTDLTGRYPQLKGQYAPEMGNDERRQLLREEMEYEGANAPSSGAGGADFIMELQENGKWLANGQPIATAAGTEPTTGTPTPEDTEPGKPSAAAIAPVAPDEIDVGGETLVSPMAGQRPRELGGLIGAGVKAAGPVMAAGKIAMGKAASMMQGDPRKGAEAARRTLPKLQENLKQMKDQFGTETDPYRKQKLFDTIRETTRLIATQQELVDRYP